MENKEQEIKNNSAIITISAKEEIQNDKEKQIKPNRKMRRHPFKGFRYSLNEVIVWRNKRRPKQRRKNRISSHSRIINRGK